MIAIWRQLIWKECREQIWKMIAVGAIGTSMQLYFLISDAREEIKSIFFAVAGLVCGAFFVALGVAAQERSAGSLEFVRSLPLARWKWAVVRLVIGAIAVLAPLIPVIMLVVFASLFIERPIKTADLAYQGTIAAILCLSVYLWTVAAGVNRTSELKAGLAAVCMFVAWLALVAVLDTLCRLDVPSLSRIYESVLLFSPGGICLLPSPAAPAEPHSYVQWHEWQVYLPQLLSLAGAALWSVRRYGRMTATDNRSPTATSAMSLSTAVLRPPRRTPLAAMAWKEYREAIPICLAGLTVAAVFLLPGLMDMATPDKRPHDFTFASRLIVSLGTIMALVLGVGGHTGDLDSGVWQFWRSRPIRPAGWFWIKYFIGMIVLLVSFDGPLAAIDLMAGEATPDELRAAIADFADGIVASLQSSFMVMPKTDGFVEYATFEAGYRALRRATRQFKELTPETLKKAVETKAMSLIVVRTILGFSPPEWAYLACERTRVEVTSGYARSLDIRIRKNPDSPLSMRGVAEERIGALLQTACELMRDGAPPIGEATLHRLDKCDTQSGQDSLEQVSSINVPYPMLLYERLLGRPFATHRDAVSEKIADVMEVPVEEALTRAGIPYRKTKRAEKLAGFDQAPDFCCARRVQSPGWSSRRRSRRTRGRRATRSRASSVSP